MKTKLITLCILFAASVLFARYISYNRTKPPKLSLPAAYERALTVLGLATNEFHCVGAGLHIALSSDGEWLFSFASTNGKPKYVTVEFNGQTHVEDIIVR